MNDIRVAEMRVGCLERVAEAGRVFYCSVIVGRIQPVDAEEGGVTAHEELLTERFTETRKELSLRRDVFEDVLCPRRAASTEDIYEGLCTASANVFGRHLSQSWKELVENQFSFIFLGAARFRPVVPTPVTRPVEGRQGVQALWMGLCPGQLPLQEEKGDQEDSQVDDMHVLRLLLPFCQPTSRSIDRIALATIQIFALDVIFARM